ncbi:MAG: 50S ribosomal protein L3 N(5)-glutamine methyltransferase [Planctomycetota bacterium]
MTTLDALLHALAERFDAADLVYGHGTDNAWDEAVALALGVLDWPDDATQLQREVSEQDRAQIEALARRRVDERMPVPLLLGRATFAGRWFHIAPGVMVPRSPIAALVGTGFRPWLQHSPSRILDLCCGNGCIGISAALAFPAARLWLQDIDADARALARRNLELHGLTARASVVGGSLFEDIVVGEAFDLILSNPPYVPSVDSDARPAEFRFEPDRAFDGGPEGLDVVAPLLAGSAGRLSTAGLLVVEVGQLRAAVEAAWPVTPFLWPHLEAGGEGVFVLDAAGLAAHTSRPEFGQ